MPGTIRLAHFHLVICGAALTIFAASTSAQRRVRIPPPTSLLDVLDKDDRECVLTNGGLAKSVHTQSMRLAADGTRTLLVKGSGSCLCGAQNCGFWVYRQKNRNYQLLLKGAGSTKVKAGPDLSKGYRDIVSESHASAIETIVRTYRFDGSEYRLAGCLNRAYYDDKGKPTRVPISRPCHD